MSAAPTLLKSPTLSPRQPVFYAVVQHDFAAERADELDAKAGDHISVVAQSNFEWFVAKPINRLGRPGLIPVSFVSLHDPVSGRAMTDFEVMELMQRGEVPGVEEWKKLSAVAGARDRYSSGAFHVNLSHAQNVRQGPDVQ